MRRLNLRLRLFLAFFFGTVLPLAALVLFYLSAINQAQLDTVLQNLNSIADKKADQIDRFLNERFVDVQTYSRMQSIHLALQDFSQAFVRDTDHPALTETSGYRAELLTLLESGLYHDLLLIDKTGQVVFSILHEPDYATNLNTGPYRNSHLAESFRTALETLDTQLTPFRPYTPSNSKVASFLLAPVIEGQQLLGAIALQVNVEVFSKIAADRVGLGLSGETVLAQAQGDDLVIMADLRHIDDAAFNYRITLTPGASPLPILRATQGWHGQILDRDYSGHEVAAVMRYLPILNWGMVVKMDLEEALARSRQAEQAIWFGFALVLLLSMGVAGLYGRSLARPINNLLGATSKIAEGGKLHAVEEGGGPELTQLAQAFNRMVERVNRAQSGLEAEVALRNRELIELSTLQGGILDHAAYAIIATTTEGEITVFNQAAQQLFGHSAEAMVGSGRFTELFLPEELAARAADFKQELGTPVEAGFDALVARARAGLANEYEWTAVRADGSRFPLLFSVTALQDKAGEISGYLGIGSDISERKRVEHSLLESREQLKEAQRIAKVGSWTYDFHRQTLEWSDETFRLFEHDPAQFTPSYEAFLAVVHPEDRARVDQAFQDSLKAQHPYEISHRLQFADGRIKYVREACETLYDENGKALIAHGTVQDISAQKRAEETINLYANVFHHSAEAILISDHKNRIVATNPALTKLTGYSLDELRGKNPKVLASDLTAQQVYDDMWQALHEGGHWQGELIDRRKDGKLYPKWTSISVIRDERGEISNYIATFTDITERKAAQERIFYLAHHDPLTGLNNRFSLEERLEQALVQARREHDQLAVIFIDLDRFKLINDTLGHHIGDALLIEVAARLRHTVRDSDIVARLGGDEFVVALTGIDTSMPVAGIAAKIVENLGTVYHISDHELRSSASLGISVYPEDGADVSTLMKRADTAMYHAKEQGRDNYQFFTAQMNVEAQERMGLERDLRLAIEQEQFVLHYQPKVEAHSGQVVGVEALVRWQHPQHGLIPPMKFIPIAEETGLIEELGEWVFEEACRQSRRWLQQGLGPMPIAVNISAQQLHDPQLIERLQHHMDRHEISEGELELEITESTAMANAEQAIEQMQAMRKAGLTLTIDDFGTGYSSLAYLKLFPIQSLKLDYTFVRDIITDENDATICMATISLAHSLGLEVIAEGVETEAQHAFLCAQHCDFLQGYLFSRPLPEAEITAYLQHAQGAAARQSQH